MIGRLIRRVLGRTPTAPRMIGTRPGFLWDCHAHQWVPIEKALSCRCDAYSEFGPVYAPAGLPA